MGDEKKVKNIVLERMSKSTAIQKLLNASLPARISYPVAVFMRSINENIEILTQEKKKVIEKYCICGENEMPILNDIGAYSFPPEKVEAFGVEFQELMDLETTVTWETLELSLEDLEDAGLQFSPMEILSLEDVISFDTEPEMSEEDTSRKINEGMEERE